MVEDRVTRWYLTAADSLGADAAAVIHWVAARGNPAHTWQLVATAHAAGATLPPSTYELGLVAAKQLGDRRCLGEAHAYLGLAQAPDTAHLTEAIDLLEGGPVAGAAAFALGVLRSHQGRPAEGSEAIDWALTQLDPLREPISYAIALAAHAEVLDHLGAADLAQIRFAQALILCAANASERFHTDYAASFALDEFLRYVRRCLAAPKVTAADRLLAQRLLQTCHTADVGQDPLLALAVAGPGLAVAAT